MKDRRFDIDIDVWRSVVHVYIVEDIVKARNSIIEDFPLLPRYEEPATSAIATSKDEYPADYWLFIPYGTSISTISHECIHLAWTMLYQHDIDIDIYNHDSLCYTQELILERILMYINNENINIKPY